MIFWDAILKPYKLASWRAVALRQRLIWLGARESVLQWLIVILVGLGLGGYVLGASSLSLQWTVLLIIVAICPFVVMIIGNVQRLCLAVILLDIPFQFDAYLLYQEQADKLGAIPGLNVSIATVALIILYGLWLAELLTKRDKIPRLLIQGSLPAVFYLVMVTLSFLVAYEPSLAVFEIFLLVQAFLIFFYVAGRLRTRQDLLFVTTVLLIGFILESLIMIGLRGLGQSVTIGVITARIDNDTRVGGTIGSPNGAASYLALLLPTGVSLFLTPLRPAYKLMGVVAFGLGGIALILTLSRGGWISLILSLTVICALAWYRGWLSLTVPFVLIAVGLLLALLFQDLIGARLFGDDKGSALSRIPLMQIAFQMIKDHPLLGVGSNNFATVFGQYVTPRFSQEWLYTVHNKYFLVWSETGTVALGAYLWFLISAIYRGWQGWILKDRWLSPLALGFAAAVMGQMVHMNFDIFNGRPQVQLLWLIIGLMIAILKLGNVDLTISGAATTNKEVGNKVTL